MIRVVVLALIVSLPALAAPLVPKCPMCLAAIYWARLQKVYYANTRRDAARIGFDDDFIYREVARPVARRRIPMTRLLRSEALKVFAEWEQKSDKIRY